VTNKQGPGLAAAAGGEVESPPHKERVAWLQRREPVPCPVTGEMINGLHDWNRCTRDVLPFFK
jgi:hypothetical protein